MRRSAAAAECTARPTLLLFSRQEHSQGQGTRRRQQCPGNGPSLTTLNRPGKTAELPAKRDHTDHHHTDGSAICFQIQRGGHRYIVACTLGGPPMSGKGPDMELAEEQRSGAGLEEDMCPSKSCKWDFWVTVNVNIFMFWLIVVVETPKDPRLCPL